MCPELYTFFLWRLTASRRLMFFSAVSILSACRLECMADRTAASARPSAARRRRLSSAARFSQTLVFLHRSPVPRLEHPLVAVHDRPLSPRSPPAGGIQPRDPRPGRRPDPGDHAHGHDHAHRR